MCGASEVAHLLEEYLGLGCERNVPLPAEKHLYGDAQLMRQRSTFMVMPI